MKKFNEFISEGLRDKMVGKDLTEIKKKIVDDIDDEDAIELIHYLEDNNVDILEQLIDIKQNSEEITFEDILNILFFYNIMIGIKYVLDNFRLYGKETRLIIRYKMIKLPEDSQKELIKEPQIRKMLGKELIHLYEKYLEGKHKDVIFGSVEEYVFSVLNLEKNETINPEYTLYIKNDKIMLANHKDSNAVYYETYDNYLPQPFLNFVFQHIFNSTNINAINGMWNPDKNEPRLIYH